MIDQRRCKYIKAIAECHSFSRAAQQLYVSQPSLSRFVRKVEDELGVELFERDSIPLGLTPAGHKYLEYIERFQALESAMKKDFASITVEKAMMNSEIGFGRKVLDVFEQYGISFEHMPSGIDTMTIFVHQDEFVDYEQSVIAGIHRAVQPDFVDLEADLALIAVVGRGMKSARGTAGRIFSALAHARVNVKMIDQGSSELNIIIGVKNDDFEPAIKAIYDIFITAEI